MSHYHVLLNQLDTIVKADNVTASQVEKIITELKVLFYIVLNSVICRFGQIQLTSLKSH